MNLETIHFNLMLDDTHTTKVVDSNPTVAGKPNLWLPGVTIIIILIISKNFLGR